MFVPFGLVLTVAAVLLVGLMNTRGGPDDRRPLGKAICYIGAALVLSPLVIIPTLIMAAVGVWLVQLLSPAGP